MQANPTPQYFTNRLIFASICQYLKIQQLLTLSAVSRELRNILEQYVRNLMKELHMKPSSMKSSLHQMQFYFNRCLKIATFCNKGEEMKNDNVVINYPFKFQTIHYFEVGTTFCCYLTRDDNARIMRTSNLLTLQAQYLNKKYKPKNQQISYESRANIKEIKCKSQQAVLLKTNGQVFLLTTDKNNNQTVIMQEDMIAWSANIPISTIYNSFVYSILCPKVFTNLTTIFSQVFKRNWWKKESERPQYEDDKNKYLICRNMQINKQIIIEVPVSQIIDGTVGNRHAYFISSKNQLYQADLQEKTNLQFPIVKAQVFEPLRGKKIAKIVNGYNYFIAVQRNVEELEDWDTQRVVQWLRDIGFQAYAKIARFQKLDGKKLKSIQRKYMHNVLGITTQNMQQKFLMSIDQHLNKKFTNDQLWGWGRNDTGQLGSSSANVIKQPQKIRFPNLQPGEFIDSIFCGWFQTFIRTQKGRIYQTMMKSGKKRKGSQYQKDEDKKQAENDDESEVKTNDRKVSVDGSEQEDESEQVPKISNKKKSSSSKNNSRKRKRTVELTLKQKQKEKSNRKYEEQDNWFEFEYGKAFFIQAYKQTLFIIQCPNQVKEQPNKIIKLRTAKAVLDKILWSSVNKEQFRVGYMDKDMGLIQATALDMQKFDVKQNRIKYFKKNNTIVWDRDNKIDLF